MNFNKIIVIGIIFALAFSAVPLPEGEAQGAIREFRDVHVNMKSNEKFTPEYEHRNDTEPQRKRVAARYDQYGPLLSNPQYVDVGTWTSDNIAGDMTIKGGMIFNIWFIEVSENADGANDPDWIFDLKLNGDVIANVEIQDTQSSATEVIEITAPANLPEPITASSSDTFSVSIQYRGWEDIDVYFDTVDYDSGAMISMDSLAITQADKSGARFYDAWGLNWEQNGKYFCSIDYGGVINMGDEETDIEDGGTAQVGNGTDYQVTKIKFNNIVKGSGKSVSVSITYGPNGTSEAWTANAGEGSSTEENGDGDLPVAMIGGGVIVLVLVAVFAYLFVFKKGAEEDDEEYDDEEEEDKEEEGEEEEDEEDEE